MRPCGRICTSILFVATTLLAAPLTLAKDAAIRQEAFSVRDLGGRAPSIPRLVGSRGGYNLPLAQLLGVA
jgi:hypothetical protein